MKTRHGYLILSVLGIALPYAHLIPWLAAHGIDVPLFTHDLFANGVSGFFAVDVVVSALVVFWLVYTEGRRMGVRHLWAPVAAVLLVGVSFGLPLYLYQREVHLERTAVS